MGDPARGLGCRLYLRKHRASVVEEHAPGWCQFDAARAPRQKLGPDLFLEVSDLTAKRRLRGVQLFLCRQAEALGLGDRNEIAQVPEFHLLLPCSESIAIKTYKVPLEVATSCTARHLREWAAQVRLMPNKHTSNFEGSKGEGQCQRHWKERSPSSRAVRGASGRQSPSARAPTERAW